MPALLILIATLMTWAALHQGILAFAIVPPPAADLATVTGIVRSVDTPVSRNRFVPSTEVTIAVTDTPEPATAHLVRPDGAGLVRVPVRRETLPLDTVRTLLGQTVTATWAAGRPRNRWVYALDANGIPLAFLATERARDASARNHAFAWCSVLSLIAIALFVAAWRLMPMRRRDPLIRWRAPAAMT